jgi:hypothetical protein
VHPSSEARIVLPREMCLVLRPFAWRPFHAKPSCASTTWVVLSKVPPACAAIRSARTLRACSVARSVVTECVAAAASAPQQPCSRRFLFTMSNSAVFFVPAARCCARVLLLSAHPTPNEGRAERRQAQCFSGRARPQDVTPRSAFRIVSRRRSSRASTYALCIRNSIRSQ